MTKFPNFIRVLADSETHHVQTNGKIEIKTIFVRSALKITQLLAQTLNFSYDLKPARNSDIGKKLPNGSWTGMIGSIQRNETDMVIGTVAVTVQRLQVADFSYFYNRDRITFATRKPEYQSDLLALLLPFSLDVWLFTVSTLLLIPATWFTLFHKKYVFTKLVFAAYKTIISQDMGIKPTISREYLLLSFWQIGTKFLIFCYTCVLLSFLTFPTLSGIRTVPELAAAIAEGKCQCTGYPGAFLSHVLLNSADPIDKIIGRNLLQNNGSRDIETVLDSKTLKKMPVFIGGDTQLLAYKMKYFISKDEILPALISIVLQKNFCCKRQLDRVIGYVWASGIFEKLKQDHMFLHSMRLSQQSTDTLERHRERFLSLEDLAGAFVLLALGNSLATIILIMEIIIGKRCRKNNHRYFR